MEVLVLFNYDGQAEDELTIRKGDVILDVKKLEGGWWEGLLGCKRGLFPDNFVMVVTEAEMNHTSPPSVRTEKGRKCRALFSYSPSHEDELELLVGDEIHFLGEVEEGWWRGKLAGRIGVFPSNFVIMEETPSAITPVQPLVGTAVNSSAHSPDVAPELPPKPLKEIARVLFPYSSLQPDELELKEGDLVIIHSKDCEDKGWWKGEVNNKIGVFPDNFVEIISASGLGFPKHEQQQSNSTSTSITQTPQSRTGVSKTEYSVTPSVSSEPEALASFHLNVPKASATGNESTQQISLNTSLSDEQKLQQNGETYNFHVIIPVTESLEHLTASRARPTKRRPPSASFIKDYESNITTTLGDSPAKQEVEGGKLPKVEEHSRPTTKTRSTVKPPWMEELKRNQEKKGSIATSGTLEKPSVPSAKPTVPKPVNTPLTTPQNFQVNASLGENAVISNEAASKKSVGLKQNNFKLEPSNSSTVPPKYSPSQLPKRSDGSPILTPASPPEKATHKDPSLPSESSLFEIKKQIMEKRTPLSVKDHPSAGSNGHDPAVVLKPKTALEPASSVVNKQPSTVSNHHIYNESSQSRPDDAIFLELRTLNSRVATLEATILSLQSELLHLKNTTSVHEHKCQCVAKKASNESFVHI